jgi:hypothetical protein
VVAPWPRGKQTVRFLIDRGRLESIEASDLTASAEAQVSRATLRLNATAVPALGNGDVDGAYAAAYDAYRMAAEALLAARVCVLLAVMARACRSKMPYRPSSRRRSRHSPSRPSND